MYRVFTNHFSDCLCSQSLESVKHLLCFSLHPFHLYILWFIFSQPKPLLGDLFLCQLGLLYLGIPPWWLNTSLLRMPFAWSAGGRIIQDQMVTYSSLYIWQSVSKSFKTIIRWDYHSACLMIIVFCSRNRPLCGCCLRGEIKAKSDPNRLVLSPILWFGRLLRADFDKSADTTWILPGFSWQYQSMYDAGFDRCYVSWSNSVWYVISSV